MTTTVLNGRPRKQLSEQLDRLDSIIDALADGLPAAVAAAAREGTRQAVKDAIVEILTNPELRGLIAGVGPAVPSPAAAARPAAPPPPKPNFWARAKAQLAALTATMVAATGPTVAAVVGRYRAATGAVRLAAAVLPVRRMLVVGAGIGLAVGVSSYVAPHGVAAALGGVGWATTVVAAQVGAWLRAAARAGGLWPR